MIRENNPLVSIIIPVYNVEKYLKKCLDSIVNQTYRNLEIIVVNDGSPDNSWRIIEKYQQEDTRIVYVKRQNGGLGAARNSGIEVSHGEFLCFVDSDDWISLEYVDRLLNVAITDNSDVVICNMQYIYSDGQVKPRTPKITKYEIINSEEALKREFIGDQYKFHAPNKFCKRDIFIKNNIRFPEGKVYEDVMTTYKYFLYTDRVSLIPNELYFYLQSRDGSIMHAKIKQERFDDMYYALSQIVNNAQIKNMDIENEVQNLFAVNIISLVNYIYPLYGVTERENFQMYRKQIMNPLYGAYINKIIKNKKISKVVRLRVWMIRDWFTPYCRVMKLLKSNLNG